MRKLTITALTVIWAAVALTYAPSAATSKTAGSAGCVSSAGGGDMECCDPGTCCVCQLVANTYCETCTSHPEGPWKEGVTNYSCWAEGYHCPGEWVEGHECGTCFGDEEQEL